MTRGRSNQKVDELQLDVVPAGWLLKLKFSKEGAWLEEVGKA